MTEFTSIDDFMNIDDSTLDFFTAPSATSGNPLYYKTPINDAKSEDGHYRSQIRLLWNPFNHKRSLVKSVKYSMRDKDGFFQAISLLSEDNRNCPLFKAWKKLHFAKKADGTPDTEKDEWSKKMYDKSEATYCLIQVIDDQNHPELKGQFKLWKLPKAVLDKVTAKIRPAADSNKMAVPVLDFILGPVLDIDVTPGPDDKAQPIRRTREISYSLCDFENDPCPILNEDGSPFFTDDEISLIEDYNSRKVDAWKAQQKVLKATAATKAKAEAEYAKKVEAVNELSEDIRPLYAKALEYLKGIAPDVAKEEGYTPWSPELTARVNAWIDMVANMQDPANDGIGNALINTDVPSATEATNAKTAETHAAPAIEEVNPFDEDASDDLPF